VSNVRPPVADARGRSSCRPPRERRCRGRRTAGRSSDPPTGDEIGHEVRLHERVGEHDVGGQIHRRFGPAAAVSDPRRPSLDAHGRGQRRLPLLDPAGVVGERIRHRVDVVREDDAVVDAGAEQCAPHDDFVPEEREVARALAKRRRR